MRYLGVALLVPLLSGCEPKLAPAKVEPEKPSTPAVQQVQPAASVPPAAPAIAAEPVAPARTPQSTPVKKPLAAPAGSSAVPAVKQDNAAKEPPKSKLDLSLPPELTEQLNAERGDTEQALEPLLPSLFEEKASADNPFQLNGRLLSNERGDDYFKSLEGAEVQFEFKR
jgi:hypothetical protein